MIRLVIAFCACLPALPLLAQTPADRAQGAILRMLDKVSGDITDLTLLNGDEARLGRLIVRLAECRFPPSNPQGEAYAWIDVYEGSDALFSGWMIASSPALSALDHPRYDVWVLRCSNS